MTLTLDDINAVTLPPEVQADLDGVSGRPTALDEATFYAGIAQELVTLRKEAIDGRAASGIEAVWEMCEDLYAGIDDMNRAQMPGRIRWQKPPSMDGPLTSDDTDKTKDPTRSVVFVPVTARYVNAAAAKVGEILLSPDDKSFTVDPTPVPDLIDAMDDPRPVGLRVNGEVVPAMRAATPEDLSADTPPASPQVPPAPAVPPGAGAPPPLAHGAGAAPAPGVQITVRDFAKEKMAKATKRAKAAEKRIHDWMVETRYSAVMRRVIKDAAKLGTGIVKGPFPMTKKAYATQTLQDVNGKDLLTLKVEHKIIYGIKKISVWDFFPDPSCGEHIHDGDYCFERDRITERKLAELAQEDGYIPEAIAQVIKEGPSKIKIEEDRKRGDDRYDKRYEIWYFTGYLKKDKLLALAGLAGQDWQREMETDLQGPLLKDLDAVPVICTLVNDTIIRAVLHPNDTGEFYYHAIPWLTRDETWAGKGVAEQGEVAQRMINGATRALNNNTGQTAGAQIVIDTLRIEPTDGIWRITPNKLWQRTGDEPEFDVQKAFEVYEFPSRHEALMAVIEYGFRLYEESTNIPLVTQGQSGKTTPETLGGMQLQDNNANQLLRSVAYTFDDYGTEPMVMQWYQLLLLDPEVPADEKGDWKINAHGSAALVERHIQNQTIVGMSNIVLNPAFAIDPKKWLEQYLKGNHLKPTDFQYTEEEQKALAKQPPPKAPAVQAAEIRAQVDMQKAKLDTDRDTAYVQAETERTQKEFEVRMAELEAKTRLEMLKYANQHKIKLMEVKAQMAETAMKVQAQRELSAEDRAGEVLKPPSEPKGRAENGDSYEG